MDKEEIIKAIANGTIDMSVLDDIKKREEEKELLARHPYKIYLSSEGWSVYLPDNTAKHKRKKVRRKNKSDVEKAIIDYQRSLIKNPTIREIFEEWNQNRLEIGKIAETTYMRNKQIFARHFKEFGERRIADIQPEEIADFLEKEISRCNLTAKSFANLKGLTKGVLKRAKKQKLFQHPVQEIFDDLDISDCFFAKTIHEDSEEVFDELETRTVMEYCLNNQDLRNLGILLMFLTGMRVGEVSALKHNDIHDCAIDIRRTETRKAKSSGGYSYPVKAYPKTRAGVRTVIVPEQYKDIVAKLYEMSADREYIFMEGDIRIDTFKIRKRLTKICKELGIVHKAPQKIRKTYGSILLDAGIDQKLITDQMGHSDISITEKYYHRNRKSLERKSKIISSIPDFQ